MINWCALLQWTVWALCSSLDAYKLYLFFWLIAPHITGLALGFFTNLLEAPVVGPLIVSYLRKKNNTVEVGFPFTCRYICLICLLLLVWSNSIVLLMSNSYWRILSFQRLPCLNPSSLPKVISYALRPLSFFYLVRKRLNYGM